MTNLGLIRRNLLYYWRTNAAVLLGVSTAVAVLAGALLVGESVRASLRRLVLGRLGKTDQVIASTGFFRERLATEIAARGSPACPLISVEGFVTHQESGRRAAGVQVYGVDERFWRFHERQAQPLGDRQMLLSESLAREIAARPEDGVLLRIGAASAIPAESLHGRKDNTGRTIRFSAKGTLAEHQLGEFSLRPQQGDVRAVFVALRRLQKELEQPGRVNNLLVSGAAPLQGPLRETFLLEDLGLRLRRLEKQDALSLESESGLLSDAVVETARAAAAATGLRASGVFTYLANTMRVGGREVPYSLATALEGFGSAGEITLNEWAARDLGVRGGETLAMEYFVWTPENRLATRSAPFRVAKIVPIQGFAADPDLAPHYPGITDSDDLGNWDPPFPLDLKRVRPRDEDYWDRYRTTPKAFLSLERGQQLWQSRYGKLTSLRLTPITEMEAYRANLRSALDPLRMGLAVHSVRAQGLEASQGTTDFGEYFVYFSFFLVASAVLLAALFFRLGVEQRRREIGILRAAGFPMEKIRRQFLAEGAALAAAGSIAGLAGGTAYAALILYGLRTWWVDAVGTRRLELEIAPGALALGGLGGLLTALVCIGWTLRGLRPASPRSLVAGSGDDGPAARRRTKRATGFAFGAAAVGLGLLAAAAAGRLPQAAGFFGAGALLLAALLAWQWTWLARPARRPVSAVAALGLRNAAWRPGRSTLSIALIASAIFLLVAVDAFRRPQRPDTRHPKSGSGGFPLLAESLLPIVYDLRTEAGRRELNLPALGDAGVLPFRLRGGDDASCLNLYRPASPRILGAPGELARAARFSFQSSLARAPQEKDNPWLLLETPAAGAIPAIVDANSMTYSLHLKLGQELLLEPTAVGPVRLRLVAALSHSVFQSEVLISEENFRRLFPDLPGYRVFLLDAPEAATGPLEETLTDYGFDVQAAADRLAAFDRVENTYLATFQSLGALGLLLGTVGLAAALLRGVLEQRRELALLQAVGYRRRQLALLVIAENALVVAAGVATGTVCALVAIAPALVSRGGRLSVVSLALLVAAVAAAGMAASLAAVLAVSRSPLLEALRSE